MDKPLAYYAFEMLCWCGLREGRLLALAPSDFDFEKGTMSVSKTYTRLNRKDVITTPKTEKEQSNRSDATERLRQNAGLHPIALLAPEPDERIFPFTKYFLTSEMQRGSKAAGVKRIRIHDLRHSHILLLIDHGFPAHRHCRARGTLRNRQDITCLYMGICSSRQTEMAEKLDVSEPKQRKNLMTRKHRTIMYIRS